MAKGTFIVTLTVGAQPPPPLAVASPEDMGDVGGTPPASLEITGGVPPYTVAFDPTSGPPPPGITINSDGTISGSPTQAGSFDVILDVADSLG